LSRQKRTPFCARLSPPAGWCGYASGPEERFAVAGRVSRKCETLSGLAPVEDSLRARFLESITALAARSTAKRRVALRNSPTAVIPAEAESWDLLTGVYKIWGGSRTSAARFPG